MAANILKQSGVPGEILPWREALFDGPTPRGLGISEWHAIRARFLSNTYTVPYEQCLADLTAQQQRLESSGNDGEIVLWFEHDLFCQTLLMYLLDWLAMHTSPHRIISLICIDSYPGITPFHGLGQLTPEQMAGLMTNRERLTPDTLTLGRAAWKAYCSSIPLALETFLAETDLSPLPFLAPALHAHLRRYPSTRNGLGILENRFLELLKGGETDFPALFRQLQQLEPIYGFGDWQLGSIIEKLGSVSPALVEIISHEGESVERSILRSKFNLTDHGRNVLEGTTDFIEAHGMDQWLGGVRLNSGQALFRYDDSQGKIIRAQ